MKRESPDPDGSTDKIYAFDSDELNKYEAAVRADEAAKSKAEIERLRVRANNALGVMEARCRAYEDLEQEHIDLRAKADALRDAAYVVLGRLCDHMRGITYNEAGTEKIAGEIDAFNATCAAYDADAPIPEPEGDPLAGIPKAESIADCVRTACTADKSEGFLGLHVIVNKDVPDGEILFTDRGKVVGRLTFDPSSPTDGEPVDRVVTLKRLDRFATVKRLDDHDRRLDALEAFTGVATMPDLCNVYTKLDDRLHALEAATAQPVIVTDEMVRAYCHAAWPGASNRYYTAVSRQVRTGLGAALDGHLNRIAYAHELIVTDEMVDAYQNALKGRHHKGYRDACRTALGAALAASRKESTT